AKKRLWGKLLEFRREIGEASWCILGDFNVVCHGKERRVVNMDPTTSQAIEINHFDQFLREADLEDLRFLGRRFTWYHPNDVSMNRIDIVLVSRSESWCGGGGGVSLDTSEECFRPLSLDSQGRRVGLGSKTV
ncbi:hypothetical protein MTR_5g034955, partial [Medicago truncatula]